MIYIHDYAGEQGVYVAKSYPRGAVMREFKPKSLTGGRTRTSIQVAPNTHVEDEIGKYINHSCSPTCRIEEMSVISIVDLKEGDELTFDYSENEDEIASPFECRCCGKLITGKSPKEAHFDGAGIYLSPPSIEEIKKD
tara:strand:- start:396 stop:809 length:414 start_codon:yes stop_codon:yes gene_type:complete